MRGQVPPLTLAEAVSQYGLESGAQRAAMVRRYFDFAGALEAAKGDACFSKWLRSLGESGLKPGTVDAYRRVVRAWFRRWHMPPPTAKGFKFNPDADQELDMIDPATMLDLLAALPRIPPLAAASLALSATYGLRAGEIAAVGAEDVRPGQIFLRAEKGSVSRWCWLPPEVASWLPSTWPRRSPHDMAAIWRLMWTEALRAEAPTGVGWHAVRYALVGGLRALGVSDLDVTRFLRWKAKATDPALRMVAHYGAPTTRVSAAGRQAVEAADQGLREADAAVWVAHPFLRFIVAKGVGRP